jgi:NifB/MoaA-like Fe-S oxidoreductase
MINAKRVVVVLPAYNAEKTLEATVRDLPETVDATIKTAGMAAIRKRAMPRRWPRAPMSSS